MGLYDRSYIDSYQYSFDPTDPFKSSISGNITGHTFHLSEMAYVASHPVLNSGRFYILDKIKSTVKSINEISKTADNISFYSISFKQGTKYENRKIEVEIDWNKNALKSLTISDKDQYHESYILKLVFTSVDY